jgi:hypothetical protein
MVKSDIPAIHSSMAQALADFGLIGVAKDQLNTFQKFNYRSITATLEAVNTSLAKNKIYMVQNTLNPQMVILGQDAKGTNVFQLSFTFEVVFVSGIDGSQSAPNTLFVAGDGKDLSKLTGILTSYAFKETMFKIFSIPVEGADDLDSRDGEGIPLAARADMVVKTNKAGVIWRPAPKTLKEAVVWAKEMTGWSEDDVKSALENAKPDADGKKFGDFVTTVKSTWDNN